ncbi:hypothetical protein FCH28_17720 [Streptomyces piniterrae]|uniref:Uncharacterized protein n=1 Tax=Streptomyces piniterrae TaxID=2571125 RepID=A0A4V5MKF2_9ACTN|nr:hypothetical protein [Streptomyces piniterrae]TJZ52998.1 hypothetical protein FCH28_17720 [Streptomyces piniterrae]
MPDLPDYFDRLLARHAPASAAGPLPPGTPAGGPDGGGGGRPARVRPRLPGPFERIEALRGARDTFDDEAAVPALLAPPAPQLRLPDGPFSPIEREVRTTERETVLRTGPAVRDASDAPDGSRRPDAPLLRPAASPAPPARPGSGTEGVRTGRRTAASPGDDGTAGRAPGPRTGPRADRATATASPATPLQPRSHETAARTAARQAASGRRGGRPAERVVHVQIGRLEVTAAGGPDRTAATRPERTVRPGPALSLADYLSRDEKRN